MEQKTEQQPWQQSTVDNQSYQQKPAQEYDRGSVEAFGSSIEKHRRKALSNRELDVLTCMKDGMKNPEIAGKLTLSTKTIENHVRNILLKLGAKNRTQAVVEALRDSIITF